MHRKTVPACGLLIAVALFPASCSSSQTPAGEARWAREIGPARVEGPKNRSLIAFDTQLDKGKRVFDRICVAESSGRSTKCVVRGRVPGWTPDGDRLVLIKDDSLVFIDPHGGHKRILRQAANTTWSPDGSYVSFVSYKPPSGIYVVDVSSGKIRSIIRGSVNGPSWSPRGHWIAFFVGHTKPGSGATFHLEIAHPDGSDRHTLHLTADDSSDPFWSPDGCTLGYRHSDGGGDSVILSDMKNGNPIGSPTKIALKGSLDYVTWSPNGELLAINERSEPGHLINVYRAPDFDRPILGPIRRTLYPTFSPNSRRIAYSGIKGGAPRILVTRISDGVTHALPKRGRFEHNPSWRPRPRIQPNC